nr:hypothetical protein [Tanacetum cinerariifolium]
KAKYVSEWLDIVLTTLETRKGASTIAKQFDEIKLKDLSKFLKNVPTDFIDLDSLKDDHIIIVDESKEDEEDKDEGIHAEYNVKTKDTSVPKPPSPRSIQLEELTNQVLIL